ncbi:response regulator transcription factor [Noviherbaspirillum sedimenti]|uniref:DNA-binding response regulator n=1 Tax=Noviherbaspirillum sedimenti TaxID=2320865 RepID=A0A3A3G849_9BURK|nr:response regulator transcription factor [Noviherbaspirillum sedimenti]RJG03994.1 DNA-binding response regulator [Noviherbaspirillum sedimenti]
MSNNKMIRVLLVDDHTVARNGVRLMLSEAQDIEVKYEAESAEEAIRLVREHEFDVALLDIALPGKNGLDLLKLLHIEHPKLAVLILSMYSEEVYALRALKLGAAGYLTKSNPAATMVAAVRKAAAGGKYISPSLVEKLADMLGNESRMPHETLSDRELEILKLIAAGESLVKIGLTLHLSPKTITTYRTRILEKLDLSTNAELARYARANGLLM